jgi:NADPH:quinone reductase
MLALAISAREAPPAVMDVDDRDPGSGEVRVAVEAASVNGFDLAVAAGRVWDTMKHTFPVVLGRDFAGTVDRVGDGVDGITVGDRVAGLVRGPLGAGGMCERIVADATSVVRIPPGVTTTQAAAVGLAGITALDLVTTLDVTKDDVVLVSGATGGVGAFAVQLAALRGARVLGTAAPGEASAFVMGLGATDTVDHTGDLAAAVRATAPDGVTKVAHAAGNPAVLAALLRPGGHLVSLLGATADAVGRDDVTVTAIVSKYTPEKLTSLLEDVAADRLEVPIGATHPLRSATDALDDFRASKLGKVVVTTG